MILRTLNRQTPNTTNHTKKCLHPDVNGYPCGGGTREGKPYCPEHVDEHDYVKDILQILADQEEEHKNISKRGIRAIKDGSLTVTEIGKLLANRGVTTVNRVSREMNLDLETTKVYARYLVKKDLVISGKTNRGNETLALPRKPN